MTRSDLVEQALGRVVHLVPFVGPSSPAPPSSLCGLTRDWAPAEHGFQRDDPNTWWLHAGRWNLGLGSYQEIQQLDLRECRTCVDILASRGDESVWVWG